MIDSYYRRTAIACFITNITMSATANLPPLLFLTFRELYGISYTKLGLLVLINFVTQLTLDLLFSFLSDRFDLALTLRLTPLISAIGLVVFALVPTLFPNVAYAGLVVGTVIFSAGSGLAEVLTSPTIAAMPSDNPERTMSMLHSVYAWGVVGVVVVASVYILLVGAHLWYLLVLGMAAIPVCATIMFTGAPMPPMQQTGKSSDSKHSLAGHSVLPLCVLGIFLGGASENVMSQWCSSYLEAAVGIPKFWGDLFGVALFGAMLGLGRSLYSKIGKNIGRVLILGSAGAAVCYVVAVVSPVPVLGLAACAFTGFCVSMLWPGSLIVAADRIPNGGVALYALMAAGGDFGAALCSQLVGIIADNAEKSELCRSLATRLALDSEQLGMRCGIAVAALIPICGTIVFIILSKIKKRRNRL